MHWLYILIAAVFETAWTFSLKIMKFSELKTLRWDNFFKIETGLPILLPFLGYIFFGIGNIYFFSMAMKKVPAATAFAVWTAVAIILIKVADTLLYQQKISMGEIFFMILITVGIIGLKFNSAN
jgi:multidrug transporter EmrE-like cation transporter